MQREKKMFKTGISLILSLAILMSLLPTIRLTASAVGLPNAGGALGTEESPYIVDEVSDLVWLSDNVGTEGDKYYIQTCDIDMKDVTSWSPIGDFTNPFTGTYDGQGYEIENLTITNLDSADGYGFWHYVKDADLKNIKLVNTNYTIEDQGGAGLLVVLAESTTIANCCVSGSITQTTPTSSIGGLVGCIYSNSTVTNSYSDVTLTIAEDGLACIGGLIGYCLESNVTNSYSVGDITAERQVKSNQCGDVGGLIGRLDTNCTISNCYSSGKVSSEAESNSDDVNNGCRGGFIGLIYAKTGCTVSNCFYDSTLSGQNDNCGKGTPKTSDELQEAANFISWDFTNIWTNTTGANNGYPVLRVFEIPVNECTYPKVGIVTDTTAQGSFGDRRTNLYHPEQW